MTAVIRPVATVEVYDHEVTPFATYHNEELALIVTDENFIVSAPVMPVDQVDRIIRATFTEARSKGDPFTTSVRPDGTLGTVILAINHPIVSTTPQDTTVLWINPTKEESQ